MRYSSIDLLRTFAIFVMVVVHFCENLAGYTPAIAGFGAPMFMLLSGVSYRLWLNGQLARDVAESDISKTTVRRGLFLFGLGFVFNIFIWLPEDAFNWDVLTLIGFGLIVLNIARRLPPELIILFCALVYIISPVARSIAQWPTYWTDGYFDPDWTLSDIVQGFLVVGYFPVLPWIIFPLAGFASGTLVFGQTRQSTVNFGAIKQGMAWGLGLIGIASAVVVIRIVFAERFPSDWPAIWTMFPPSAEYVMGVLGFAVFSFFGGYWVVDHKATANRFVWLKSVTATFSRYSLSAYILHHIAHVWPMWVYAVATGQETTYYWQQVTTVPTAICLACVYFMVSFALFRWMERTERPGIESAMRWLCD